LRKKKTLLKGINFEDLRGIMSTDEIFFVVLKWGLDRISCPHCGEIEKIYINLKRFKCHGCKKSFSARHGTPFERSKVSARGWVSIFSLSRFKNPEASCELTPYFISKKTGIEFKTVKRCLKIIEENLEWFTLRDSFTHIDYRWRIFCTYFIEPGQNKIDNQGVNDMIEQLIRSVAEALETLDAN
jgi:hypothetical protein